MFDRRAGLEAVLGPLCRIVGADPDESCPFCWVSAAGGHGVSPPRVAAVRGCRLEGPRQPKRGRSVKRQALKSRARLTV